MSGLAFASVEDFADRYENVAIIGMNYCFFATWNFPPFFLNAHVYSCGLFLNAMPYKWRGRYNEDTDICLQVLSGGWCTVLVNVFLAQKTATMQMRGGNTDVLYRGDGRLKMARSLERSWPGVVSVYRRFRRPQHLVHDQWRRFDTPLKLKSGVNLNNLPPNEYGMVLDQVKPIKSARIRRLLKKAKRDGLAATT